MFRKRPTTYLGLLQHHLGAVIFTAILFGIVAFAVSAFQPQEFESNARLLMVPSCNLELGAYSASRAGERLGSILTAVIHSNTFLDAVLLSQISQQGGEQVQVFNDYGTNQVRRQNKWQQRVELEISPATGILRIAVFHDQAAEAKKTMEAILDTIDKSGSRYFGGQGVSIRRSEEHTSELQSHVNLVCRLLL